MEDQRNVGASICNSGDGTDQRVQSLMFLMMMMMMMIMMMMMMMMMMMYLSENKQRLVPLTSLTDWFL